MNGGDPQGWSAVASGWAELWGGFAEPVWRAVVDASGAGPGTVVLDVGCGSGDLLAHLDKLGTSTAGIDPATGMVELARTRVPNTDLRVGSAEHLPWPDASFDLVTSINALQFADDTLDALAEMARVVKPGGYIAISNWAEDDRNDLNTIENAVARAAGEEPLPDGDLRLPGGLQQLLADGQLDVVSSGLIDVPWAAADDNDLVSAVLLGEDPSAIEAEAPTVVEAARPFRTRSGSYHLNNAFRYALGRPRG
ncbi:class I SAM-dependent methyltransferase [Arthrobacter castelli]|uniref:class I SAM-dependent methyltransferase n=1 Tax=Arthrobacter castelli TaxID=271431 RepID=UPI000418822E|nr:class I SAM-dependent methyltransferase [Arthrobacter castelli]